MTPEDQSMRIGSQAATPRQTAPDILSMANNKHHRGLSSLTAADLTRRNTFGELLSSTIDELEQIHDHKTYTMDLGKIGCLREWDQAINQHHGELMNLSLEKAQARKNSSVTTALRKCQAAKHEFERAVESVIQMFNRAKRLKRRKKARMGEGTVSGKRVRSRAGRVSRGRSEKPVERFFVRRTVSADDQVQGEGELCQNELGDAQVKLAYSPTEGGSSLSSTGWEVDFESGHGHGRDESMGHPLSITSHSRLKTSQRAEFEQALD